MLGPDGAASVGLKSGALLIDLWNKVIKPLFPLEGKHRYNYEQMDYVNEFIRTWFVSVSENNQEFLFQQLAFLAIRYNRYPSMSLLRALYAKADPARRPRLKQVKDHADPTGYIQEI